MATTRNDRRIDPSDLLRTLFNPDALLPSQFVVTQPRQAPLKIGERTLLVAVLADAIGCFRKYLRPSNQRQRRLFAEAEAWIMDEDEPPAHHPQGNPSAFSFQHVCEVLGIDADYLRGGLRRWRDTQRQGG